MPPENGLSCQQLAISNQLRANNELIQAVGMPSAKSNSVRVEVTSTWLPCAYSDFGVKEKVEKGQERSRFGKDVVLRLRRRGGVAKGESQIYLGAAERRTKESSALKAPWDCSGAVARA